MIYMLGEETTAATTDVTGAITSGIDSTSTAIVNLYNTVKYWEAQVQAAANEYDKAIAEQELAKAEKALKEAEAAEFEKNKSLYLIGAGAGVLALIGILVFMK